MGHRKQILVCLIVLTVVFVFLNRTRTDQAVFDLGVCNYPDTSCAYEFIIGFVKPVLVGILSLSISIVALLFSSEDTYKKWRKFAYWAIPIGIFLLWIAPTTTPGGFGISYFAYTKESASWLVSGAFLIVSICIVARIFTGKNRPIITKE